MLQRLRELKDQVLLGVSGIPRHGLGSIDVSNECNLRCEHCYFFEQDWKNEWPLARWQEKFEELRANGFPFLQCTFVGGEPLLRPELIDLGRRYFKKCWVVTNGTIPIPAWKNVTWYVSVDGTKPYCEALRGKGIYERIKKHADRSDINIRTATVVTKTNHECLEELVAEWYQTRVQGMVFDFYTPIAGLDEELWPGFELRDRIIDRLLLLKKRYGDFLMTSSRVFELMRSGRTKDVTDNCRFAAKAFAFSPTGEMKEKCMLGPKADCDRCGCVVPFFLYHIDTRGALLTESTRLLRQGLRRKLGLRRRPVPATA
ncbi:MAG: radical SAM protein [Acidobacteriota bacterium]